MTADPAVQSPQHYRGFSGIQSIEITHAYRLGPDLTQAVDYILRAGRKTADPRQDLAKAAFYLRYAARHGRDLVFGEPTDPRPSPYQIVRDFALCNYGAIVIAEILASDPQPDRLLVAASWLDRMIERGMARLPVTAGTGSAA